MNRKDPPEQSTSSSPTSWCSSPKSEAARIEECLSKNARVSVCRLPIPGGPRQEVQSDASKITGSSSDKWSDGRVIFGTTLVKKVYEDLMKAHLAKNTSENAAAWTACREKSDTEVSAHLVDSCAKEVLKTCRSWPTPETDELQMMSSVEKLPPMSYTISSRTNIPASDSKFLTNIPYLGDDNRGRKNVFTQELLTMYNEKIHSEFLYDDWAYIDPAVFPDLIRVLMEAEKTFGSVVFSNKEDKLAKCRLPTVVDLNGFYEFIRTAEEKHFTDDPSIKLREAVMCVFDDARHPKELLERYHRLVRRRNPEPKSSIIPNLDEASDTMTRSKKYQMESFKLLFCRQCFKYGCLTHKAVNFREDADIYQEHAATERAKKSSSIWMTCQYAERCYKNLDEGELKKLESPMKWTKQRKEDCAQFLKSWTPTERTAFNCHYPGFENYCFVASVLLSKTCSEVMRYHALLPHIDEIEQDNQDSKNAMSKDCEETSSGYGSLSTTSDDVLLEAVGGTNNDDDADAEICTFVPCIHESGSCSPTSCSCMEKGIRCESSCCCFSSCKNRFMGCKCKTTCDSKRCPCFAASRECDADICKGCGADDCSKDNISCKNVSIQRGLWKHVKIGKSNVSGWGTFATTPIANGEFVIEYCGELISHDEAERRGHLYDRKKHTFLFELNAEFTIDAFRFGNKSRFINSSKKPNCAVKKMRVKGELRIGIYAVRDIQPGEELFINYHNVLKRKRVVIKGK